MTALVSTTALTTRQPPGETRWPGTRLAGRRRLFRSPRDLAPLAWYRADLGLYSDTALLTPQTTDGGSIGSWQDQGGRNFTLIQATGAKQPTLLKNQFNNLPVVKFTATATQVLRNAAMPHLAGNACTVVVFGTVRDSTAHNGTLLDYGTGSSNSTGVALFRNTSGTVLLFRVRDATPASRDASSATITLPHTAIWVGRYRVSDQRVDQSPGHGGATAIATLGLANTLSCLSLGTFNDSSTFPLLGELGEVVIFDRWLEDADCDDLRHYLSEKWQVPA